MRGTTINTHLEELSDEQLMDVLQNGNQDAFTILYRRYYPKVKGNVCNRLRGELAADADDIVQSVFLTLHRCTERFIRNSFVSSFLLATTHRLIVNHLEHAHRQKRDVRRQGYVIHEKLADNRASEKAEAAEAAAHFLERLTPAEAEIVRLIDIESNTAKEAAVIINAPMTTAQWRYRKAWEHIRALAAQEAVVPA
jgi:RNA polymerase sigma-70 factor (ECF subfamily)